MSEIRNLVVVLGDQLNRDASAWDGFDPAQDSAFMCEAAEEATHVWCSQQRLVVFLSAMRHFAQALRDAGVPLVYVRDAASLSQGLLQVLKHNTVQRIVCVEPGEHRVRQTLVATAAAAGVPLELREDRHFLCSTAEFQTHAKGRKQLRMEYFYREMRRRHRVLMETGTETETEGEGEQPAGGQWNYDAENREAFGPQGPGFLPPPTRFEPDGITHEVMALVRTRYATHPGSLNTFGWPVTRAQGLQVLNAFINDRLANFGRWQDAMAEGQPWLYHSHIAVALNLKLLHPREVVTAVEAAWRAGQVPLAAAEGFIRQVLGWREYVRGIYWMQMPAYLELNALQATEDLPAWFWSGDVPMRCLRDAITQTLQHGYAHHIQRLMVTGLYLLLHGVQPKQVHGWYLSVYVDAVEWVELPNTLGMSQYADGGLMASKPYAATGKYIERMSDHCRGCRFKPALRSGPQACPFTTLYWDFLLRHEKRFASHPRMALQVKNVQRLDATERTAIAARAAALRRGDWDAVQ